MATLLDDVWHVAKKAHQCDVCFGTIAPGDRYRRQRVIWEGDPGTFKAHALCDAIYWEVWNELELYEDEQPDFHEDIKPRLERIFAALAGHVGSEPDGR